MNKFLFPLAMIAFFVTSTSQAEAQLFRGMFGRSSCCSAPAPAPAPCCGGGLFSGGRILGGGSCGGGCGGGGILSGGGCGGGGCCLFSRLKAKMSGWGGGHFSGGGCGGGGCCLRGGCGLKSRGCGHGGCLLSKICRRKQAQTFVSFVPATTIESCGCGDCGGYFDYAIGSEYGTEGFQSTLPGTITSGCTSCGGGDSGQFFDAPIVDSSAAGFTPTVADPGNEVISSGSSTRSIPGLPSGSSTRSIPSLPSSGSGSISLPSGSGAR